MSDKEADKEFIKRLDEFLDFISKDNRCGEGMHTYNEVSLMQPGIGDCGGVDYYHICGDDIDKLLSKFLGYEVHYFETFPYGDSFDTFCMEKCRELTETCNRKGTICNEFKTQFPWVIYDY
jgi:hypothetical protein